MYSHPPFESEERERASREFFGRYDATDQPAAEGLSDDAFEEWLSIHDPVRFERLRAHMIEDYNGNREFLSRKQRPHLAVQLPDVCEGIPPGSRTVGSVQISHCSYLRDDHARAICCRCASSIRTFFREYP